jgi:hypothetical protein
VVNQIASELLELGKLMAKFQMIELILKCFKTRKNFAQSIKNGIDEPKHSPLELERYTLGNFLKDNEQIALIENSEIIQRLKLLNPYRNYMAHKAFAVLMDFPHKEDFLGFEANTHLDYNVLNEELEDLMKTLISEYRQV